MQSLRSIRGGGQGTLAVISIIVIGVAAFLIVKQGKQKKTSPFAAAFYYCTSCQREFAGTPDKVPPTKCRYCGQPTAVSLRKYKCKQCGNVFRGFILKYDDQTKVLIEKRKRGEKVPDDQIRSILMSPADEENWVSGDTPEAMDMPAACSVCPKCNTKGAEPIFPEPEKKK